eukprot:jgi/Ulvmu1/4954/UM206_0006.1
MLGLDKVVRVALVACSSSLGALLTALAIVVFYRYARALQHLATFPGPQPRFLLGNLAMLIGKGGEIRPLFQLHSVLHQRFGSIARFTMGSTPVLVISEIAAMKEVLVTKWGAFRGRPDFIMPLRGYRLRAMAQALIFNSTASAAGMRSTALPAFHSASLDKASAAVAAAMSRLCRDVGTRAASSGAEGDGQHSGRVSTAHSSGTPLPGQPFDIIPFAQHAAMAAAFERAFGIPMPDSAEVLVEAAEAFFHMVNMTDWFALAYLNLPDWTRPALCLLSSFLNAEAGRFNASLDTTFAIVQQLAEAYAAAHPELDVDTTPNKALLGKGFGRKLLKDGLVPSNDSMLATFLRTKNKATGEVFRAADASPFLWSFLNAAYDTTASTIAFTTFHLSQNPDALRGLQEELARHGPGAVPAAGSLSDWPFAEACVKETLRLHPFVLPFRYANADTCVAGRRVPSGTMVQAAIGVMQRDPTHFPAPDAFRPQRFVDGLSAEAALRYQPFGMGPRGCLGYRLAVFEAVVAVVTLHQRFDFHLSTAHHPNGIDVSMPGLVRPAAGVWLTAEPCAPPPQHACAPPEVEQAQRVAACTPPVPQGLVNPKRLAKHAVRQVHSTPSGHGG